MAAIPPVLLVVGSAGAGKLLGALQNDIMMPAAAGIVFYLQDIPDPAATTKLLQQPEYPASFTALESKRAAGEPEPVPTIGAESGRRLQI